MTAQFFNPARRIAFIAFGIGLIALALIAYFYSAPVHWTPEKLAQTPLHYRLYWDNAVIGQHDQSLEALPDGTWQWNSSHQMRAKVRDTAINERLVETLIFDSKPPYRLRYGEIHRNDDVFTVQNESSFVVQKGDARIVDTAVINFGLGDILYALQSIADKPDVGQQFQWKQFDTQNFRVQTVRVEVLGTQRQDGQLLWQLALSSPEQTFRSEMWVKSNGLMQRLSNGAIEMRWSVDVGQAPLSASDLYQLQAIPIDRALGDAKSIASLSLRWPQQFVLPLQKRADQYVQAGFVRTEAAVNAAASAADQLLALQNEMRYSSDNASFMERAKTLTKGIKGDEARVRALLVFVSEHLKNTTELREQTASDILRNEKGDCTEFAQLFVALARANGLPAREVSGFVYLGDRQQSFGGHTWAEVAINNKWQAVDPMWNLFGVTATHLRMGEGEQGALATLAHDPKLHFSVDHIQYKQ